MKKNMTVSELRCGDSPFWTGRAWAERLRTLVVLLAALLAGRVVAAEPTKTLDLDFSRAQTGCLANKMAPEQPPAIVATYSVYGRLRGASALPETGKRYASAALDRSGELNALRLGNCGRELSGLGHRFETGKPFALELWVNVYDVQTYFLGAFLNVIHGYKQGFRLEFNKQKWSPNGWISLTWGTETGSDQILLKRFEPGQWHQVVISYDAKSIALYVDGELAEQKDAAINFTAKGGELLVANKWNTKAITLDFKLDQLTIYDAALTAEEVKTRYEKGMPTQTFTEEQEARLSALKLEIPRDTYGYFQVGQPIPVLIDATSAADELRVNGEKHALPLQKPVSLSFPAPGMQEINLTLLAQGKVLKQADFPVAIVPFLAPSSKLGANELVSRQPEVSALGMKLNRVVVEWRELEPQKQEYAWGRLDAVMEKNQELGTECILCLTGVPGWVPRQNGSKNVPADLDAFKKIWQLLVNRYDGVRYFEVWDCSNPNTALQGSFEGKLQDYMVLLRTAAEVVREDVPGAKILAGRIDIGDGLANAAYLQKNAADFYDILSAKKYSVDPAKNYGRSLWSAKIVKAAGKPVWNTACGIQQLARTTLLPPENSGMQMQKSWPIPAVDEWTAAAWQIQDLALQLADGIGRVMLETGPSEYYPLDNGTTGLPGVKGLALAVFNGLIGQDATLSRLPGTAAGVFAIRFENPAGKKGLVLFTAGDSAVLKAPAEAPEAQLLDLFGKKLPLDPAALAIGAQPVYLLNVDTISQ